MNRPARFDPFDISAGTVWEYGEPVDAREPHERLGDAIDRHMENAARFARETAPHKPLNARTFREAEDRYFASQADVEKLLEDITMVSAERIKKALMA